MATTTTNFGWDIPQSTDLVKDGATAIAALGQDIDTAFVDFKGGTTGQVLKKSSGTDLDVEWGTASSGLTLINTTSFSGVSSQSVNDVFSATYNNYLIVIDDLVKNSGAGDLSIYLRLRVSATDSTTGYYWGQGYSLFASDTAGTGRVNNGNNFSAAGCNDTVKGYSQIWLQNPFLAKTTGYQSIQTRQDAGAYSAGYNSAATSYTGFSLVAAANNMTGTVSTYGFNK